MKFRKKPVVVEAYQWSKGFTSEVTSYQHPSQGDYACRHCARLMNAHGWIDTLESGHIVCPGDWIITGVKGEKYPCKPDIFEASYEPLITTPPINTPELTKTLIETDNKEVPNNMEFTKPYKQSIEQRFADIANGRDEPSSPQWPPRIFPRGHQLINDNEGVHGYYYLVKPKYGCSEEYISLAEHQHHMDRHAARIVELETETKELRGVLDIKQDEYVQQVGTWKIISRLEEQNKELQKQLAEAEARAANWKDEYDNVCKFANDYENRCEDLQSCLALAEKALQTALLAIPEAIAKIRGDGK